LGDSRRRVVSLKIRRMIEAADAIQKRYEAMLPVLDEQGRRWFAAAEAQAFGHGGVKLLSRITGIARSNIIRGKEEIREMAQHFGLPNWNKPASPCLSSRIPYTHSITKKKLVEIEAAEDLLNSFGFEDVRVRHYGNHGKIEVTKEELPRLLEMQDSLVEKIREIGFPAVVIDEEGMVSGKLNRAIGK